MRIFAGYTIDIHKFNDGEIYARILESVRGCDVFVIQPTSPDANLHLMELLIIVDALKRASPQRITAVIPYFGYSRQDRKTKPREPISAKLIAKMIEAAGVNRVITFDLHVAQAQGFFDIPSADILLILTTLVSLEAIYLSIFIQMTVNKHGEELEEVSEDIGEIQEDVDELQEDVEEITEEEGAEEAEEERRKVEQKNALVTIQTDLRKLMQDIEKLQQK